MKHFKKTLSLLLTAGLMLSGAACGGSNGPENPNETLMIRIPDLGYGYEWMEALADRYTQITGTKTYVDVTDTDYSYATEIQGGAAKYDIYLIRATGQMLASNPVRVGTRTYDCILADLTDIYTEPNPYDGNKQTIADKLLPGYLYANASMKDEDEDGQEEAHYYGIQYVDSIMGIVRNKKIWKDTWAIPNTTDELLSLCETIKNEGCTPFIWSSKQSYWPNFWPTWVYQYQGYDDMIRFWDGLPEKGKGDDPSAQMWNRQGWLEAMKVMENLLYAGNGYMDSYSLSVDFTTAQGYFLSGGRNIAMMINGDWIENEMKKNYSDADLDMIRTPVISSIINVLPEKTVADDAELSALIGAIDAGNTSLKGDGYDVAQADYDRVKAARTSYTNGLPDHQALVPVYSKKVDLAKDFLQFMCSDEGMMIMSKTSKGFMLPFRYTTEQIEEINELAGDYVRSCVALRSHGEQMFPRAIWRSRLFTVGGMPITPCYQLGNSVDIILSANPDTSTYKSAADIFRQNLANVQTGAAGIGQAVGFEFKSR